MTITKRIMNLFKADVHYVLDRLEEPHTALQQAIRDMEQAIEQQTLRLEELASRNTKAARDSQEVQKNMANLTQHIEECFAANNEDLARVAIRKRLVSEKQLEKLSQFAQMSQKQMQELSQQHERQKDHLQAMKEKATFFCSDPIDNERHRGQCDSSISADEVELHFLREKSRRSAATNS